MIWPDPILNRVCEEISEVTPEIQRLLNDMAETMLSARGAGLAAPQVGFALRAIVVLVKNQETGLREPVKLVNPVIYGRSGESELMREGCLSLPGYFEQVRRHREVIVTAKDENGAFIEISGDGVLAHALQHEIDHLDGITFPQYLSPLKRNLAATKFKKAKKKGMRYRSDQPSPQDFTETRE